MSFPKKRTSEAVTKKNSLNILQRKDSGNVKHSEFDQLLKSGETILMSLSPTDKVVKKQVEDDGLDKIISLTQSSPEFEGQRATLSKKTSQPLLTTTGSAESVISQESKRLEARIQQLNSDLFKERAANAELSNQVKSLLSELEGIKRRSINPTSDDPEDEDEEGLSEGSPTVGGSKTIRESPEAVLAQIEKVEIKDSLASLAVQPEPTPSLQSATSDDVWMAKYAQLEQKSNLLAKRAVQTIQETKITLLQVQQENIELQDRIRELQDDLQKREEDKAKATSLIPRLLELIRNLQAELAEEKKRRDLESEFDALHLQATRQT